MFEMNNPKFALTWEWHQLMGTGCVCRRGSLSWGWGCWAWPPVPPGCTGQSGWCRRTHISPDTSPPLPQRASKIQSSLMRRSLRAYLFWHFLMNFFCHLCSRTCYCYSAASSLSLSPSWTDSLFNSCSVSFLSPVSLVWALLLTYYSNITEPHTAAVVRRWFLFISVSVHPRLLSSSFFVMFGTSTCVEIIHERPN